MALTNDSKSSSTAEEDADEDIPEVELLVDDVVEPEAAAAFEESDERVEEAEGESTGEGSEAVEMLEEVVGCEGVARGVG